MLLSVKRLLAHNLFISGWNDIGYNMVIGNDGRLYEGRGYDVHGSHAGIHNTNSIGISVIGNFMTVSPSDEVLQRIYDAIDCAQREVNFFILFSKLCYISYQA